MSFQIKICNEHIVIRNPNHIPVLSFINDVSGFHEVKDQNNILFESKKIVINNDGNATIIKIPFEAEEHIFGLGERPARFERNRSVHSLYSMDPWNYNRKMKEIYSSFPSFVVVSTKLLEVIVNCGAETIFDFGVSDYNNITIRIPVREFEIFMRAGKSFNEIMEWHSSITGLPFKLPYWVLGHQVSRWSYYPQSTVEQIRDNYLREFHLAAIYLDIDYMNGYRIFTWDKNKFPEPGKLIKQSIKKNVRIIPILDPGIKADQEYIIFRKFLGHFVEDSDGSIFTGYVWPGKCSFPDFLNIEARKIWGEEIRKFVSIGIEGIWLDMNEPSVRAVNVKSSESETISKNALHKLDSGTKIRHEEVHNFYSYFQAMATYDSFKEGREEPFILSRSGYTGIQKYSAMWTGDNEASYDDLLLQMTMVMSLGISGMPYVGCDLGGFQGDSDYELLSRYYEMALFFPLYRNHKIKNGNDQELFNAPDRYKARIKSAIEMRMHFMEYLYSVVDESHRTGHPIIRPLFYHFYHDRETLFISDQYMVGSELIYAPQVFKDKNTRELYIPEGEWIDFNTGKRIKEKSWINSSVRFPIYLSPRLFKKVKK